MRYRIPMQPTTATLCFLCILITLANNTSGATDGTGWSRIGHFTEVDAATIWGGVYYPLFTNMFLHANFMHGLGIAHLIFDVIMLYQLGCLVEMAIGPLWLLTFVGLAAVVGSSTELAWTGMVAIGASGVVYALFGLMWAGRFRFDDWQIVTTPYNLQLLIGWAVLCIFLPRLGVANGAHFGGLAFGYCVGMLLWGRRWRFAWVAPILAIAALCVMSVKYMPWSSQWLWWKAGKAFDAKKYPEAADLFTRSVMRGGPADDGWSNVAASWHNQAIEDGNAGRMKEMLKDKELEAAAYARTSNKEE